MADQQSFAERFKSKSSIASVTEGEKKSKIEELLEKKEKPMHEAINQGQVSSTTSSQADLIYLVKGIDDGRNAWYYVLVERLKLSLFQKALNDDIIHLENYGTILHSAYGDEPPAEITEDLKKKYGIN